MCTGCSDKILEEYKQNGWQFIKKVCNREINLEDFTGLTSLHTAAQDVDIISDCSDF